MSELRDRFRALDALDVPDVMSRARIMGPKPPEPDREPPMRRIGALVLAAVIAIAAVVLLIRALDGPTRPADPSPTLPAFRQDGEVLSYTGGPSGPGDLVALDPDTGAIRTLVDAQENPGRIGAADWSPDGRWVAFEAHGRGCRRPSPTPGLWVMNVVGEPRQLTTSCLEDGQPSGSLYGLWAWSPDGSRVAVAGETIDGNDPLVLFDPATGDRTDLGEAAGQVTSLTWSPDGTRITYAVDPGGSIYSVDVGGGDHSRLAGSLGYVYGGVGGSAIQWSPDGEHIAFEAWDEGYGLYLMNADGSDLQQLAADVGVEGIWESPAFSWSPDGSTIVYLAPSGGRVQLWTAPLNGSTPTLLFESAFAIVVRDPIPTTRGPVWSPDGSEIAFEHARTGEGAVWFAVNANATGDAREIDELLYRSWRGGWYFCECYG